MPQFYACRDDKVRQKDVPRVVIERLATLSDDCHVLLDFQVGRARIDLAVLHKTGVYVVEVKDKREAVRGTIEAEKWTAGADHTFPNPYRQLQKHTDALQQFILQRFDDIFRFPSPAPTNRAPRGIGTRRLGRFTSKQFYYAPVFPILLFIEWDKEGSVARDGWTQLAFGIEHLLPELQVKNWTQREQTERLDLRPEEIARIADLLGLVPVTLEKVLVGDVEWRPNVDERVVPELRVSELESLAKLVADEHVVAIVGEPMVGKSSLVSLFACKEHSPSAVLEYDFRSSTFRMMTDAFLRKQGIFGAPTDFKSRIDLILDTLCKRRLLCIFDNFESVLDEDKIRDSNLSDLIDRLLTYRTSMQASFIVTSRRHFTTKTHNKMPTLICGGITRSLGLPFLLETYQLKREEADLVFDATNGHPLGMHVAAVRIQEYGQLGLMESTEELVRDGLRELGEDLYATYCDLDTDESRVVDTAALEPEGLDISTLREIIRETNSSSSNPNRAVMRLHRLGILSLTQDRTVRLLPLLHEYIYDRLENRRGLHRAAFSYYRRQINGTPGSSEHIDLKLRTIRHAIAAGCAAEALALLFADDLWERVEWNGQFGLLLKLASEIRSLAEFESVEEPFKGQLLLAEGRVRNQIGDSETAYAQINEAELLFAKLNAQYDQARCLSELGLVTRKLGKFGRHEYEYYELALALLEGSGEASRRALQARVLSRLARARELAAEDPMAILRLREGALEIARTLEDQNLLVTCLGAVAGSHSHAGNFGVAHKYYSEALDVARRDGNSYRLGQSLAGLGRVEERLRHLDAARELFLESLKYSFGIFERIDRFGCLGHVSKDLKQYDQSLAYYGEALKLAEQVSNQKTIAENLDGLGATYREMGDSAKSLEYLQRALQIQERIDGDPGGLANRYGEVGRTLNRMGRHTDARLLIVRAIKAARRSHRANLEGWLHKNLAETYWGEKNYGLAALCYFRAGQMLRGIRGTAGIHERKSAALSRLDLSDQSAVQERFRTAADEIEKILMDEDLGR